jgi:hypothetical protein
MINLFDPVGGIQTPLRVYFVPLEAGRGLIDFKKRVIATLPCLLVSLNPLLPTARLPARGAGRLAPLF